VFATGMMNAQYDRLDRHDGLDRRELVPMDYDGS
jgi:hypothetical protein